jgi:NADH dehydrogenase FAD-containing subunit
LFGSGKWLAKHLCKATSAPFRYHHKGMLAYVGGARALADLPVKEEKFFVFVFLEIESRCRFGEALESLRGSSGTACMPQIRFL